jgi:histidine phosphotransferase ChpT
MAMVTLEALDLAALLCSRVCHDVISPVGAIVNGLEVLEEEKDEEMREFAQDLIRKSAKQASARLQFARQAFGAAGSAGAMIDIGDAEQVARGFISDDRTRLSWTSPRVLLPKNQVKLLLNLLIVATSTIPRGGSVEVMTTVEGEQARFEVVTRGTSPRIPPTLEPLIAGEPEHGLVDSHAIQPFYTGLIARSVGMRIAFELEAEGVRIVAERDRDVEDPVTPQPDTASEPVTGFVS